MNAERGRVVVQDYDPAWPVTFEELRRVILPAVSDIAHAVEHVGSTSVPGLAAKPIIDMDVVVDAGDVPLAVSRLESVGYEHRGDLGVPGREAFRSPPDRPRHHLYVCRSGGEALANHLAVRDHLRANPMEAAEYGRLKKSLAEEFANDVAGYVQAKTRFLLSILQRVGFDPSTLSDIERINRRD